VAAKQQTETTGNCLITSGLMNGVQADGTVSNSYRAWIVLGDHAIDNGKHLLSADCATVAEVEEAAQSLKKQLDEIVSSAKVKFSKKHKGKNDNQA
jgi:hypothetical protein